MSIDSSQNNKRIAKNTLLLYVRMLFTMAVSLYTSRIVLDVLGIEDYGIYNVVGGIVALFSFLNSAMASSTQRYVTFELGRNNNQRLSEVFLTSFNIYMIISVVVIILSETLGLWLLLEKMSIPDDRMNAAIWVYQFSVFAAVISIMSYPYNAVIVAHERMSAFASISIIEVVLKLIIVYLLVLSRIDKLVLYAGLLVCVQLFVRFCYTIYCSKHFPETKLRLFMDKPLFKEMLGFTGWNLWGNVAAILFTHGLNILLNVFFGPVVNTSRGIAVQVQTAIAQFASNFQMAVNPQITKMYASNHLEEMHILICRSCKFSFCLLFILSLPILFETYFILNVWLKMIPDYAVIFVRLMIITMIIDSTAGPLMVGATATGHVKVYQSVIGGILLLILPISYVVLSLGGAPWSVFLVHLSICCIAYIVRLLIVYKLIKLDIRMFINQVFGRSFIIVICSIIIPGLMKLFLPDNIWTSLALIIVCMICAAISSFYLGLSCHERKIICDRLSSVKHEIGMHL